MMNVKHTVPQLHITLGFGTYRRHHKLKY